MRIYTHKQETWDVAKCLSAAKRIFVDGMGTAGGPRGLINCDSSPYPRYGQFRRYNGGIIINNEWYQAECVPFPKIPERFIIMNISAWGAVIKDMNDIKKKMDKFDLAWLKQSEEGTLPEDQRQAVTEAINDHESYGNWDVAEVMRKFKYKEVATDGASTA